MWILHEIKWARSICAFGIISNTNKLRVLNIGIFIFYVLAVTIPNAHGLEAIKCMFKTHFFVYKDQWAFLVTMYCFVMTQTGIHVECTAQISKSGH